MEGAPGFQGKARQPGGAPPTYSLGLMKGMVSQSSVELRLKKISGMPC